MLSSHSKTVHKRTKQLSHRLEPEYDSSKRKSEKYSNHEKDEVKKNAKKF